MILKIETDIKLNFKSQSQKIRVLTENWVLSQVYCPNCGYETFSKYPNNQPVADFFCPKCQEDYELKSKNGLLGKKIVNGAYSTMIDRLNSFNNPNLFLLSYSSNSYKIMNFLVIPKHLFIPEIIEKRKPLAQSARRAGWIGCNIVLQSLPSIGKIYLIKNSIVEPKKNVILQWHRTLFLRDERNLQTKGWAMDVMKCIEKINKKVFSIEEVYAFENELKIKYPDNHHVKDKIRQQLQILRDKGFLKFINKGSYQLL